MIKEQLRKSDGSVESKVHFVTGRLLPFVGLVETMVNSDSWNTVSFQSPLLAVHCTLTHAKVSSYLYLRKTERICQGPEAAAGWHANSLLDCLFRVSSCIALL